MSDLLHTFNIKLAKDYNIEKAIILHNIYFWIKRNSENIRNFREGNFWTYNSATAFQKQFQYMSKHKIFRLLDELASKDKILEKKCFNKAKFDRTNWYSITPKGFEALKKYGYEVQIIILNIEIAKKENDIANLQHRENKNAKGDYKNVTPIPDSKQQIENSNSKQHIIKESNFKKIEAPADLDKKNYCPSSLHDESFDLENDSNFLENEPREKEPTPASTEINDLDKRKQKRDKAARERFFSKFEQITGRRKLKQTPARIRKFKTILKNYTLHEIKEVLENIESSNFLQGQNNRNWKVDIDWILNSTNFLKVLEGNYQNLKPAPNKTQKEPETEQMSPLMQKYMDKWLSGPQPF